jgi:histidyl-tRNA synthetase
MKLQAPKGTRDFYPADMALRNWIASQWVAVSQRNGFAEYDGPIFESLDLYKLKSGDEIVAQLFHFEDRGGRAFAIRPEMTPTLARMVAARANALAKPIKWFSIPRLCRAERPQRGRLREFFQWNIDIVGSDSELADAECIFVAVDFFRALGLTPQHVTVRINSRAIVTGLLESMAIPADRHAGVYAALDKRDKLSPEAFDELLAKLALDKNQCAGLVEIGAAKDAAGLAAIADRLADHPAGGAAVTRLRQVFDWLAALGVADYCAFDMGVVRGLAYYTGTVFEAFGRGGLQRAIAGGGRYDELVSQLGGPRLGGIGFATSDVVIQDVLTEFDLLPELESVLDFFVIDADATAFAGVLEVVGRLRAAGVSTGFSFARQSINKQFKQAAGQRARRVVVVDAAFADARSVEIKDMTTGVQQRLGIDELLNDPLRKLESGS